MKTTFQFLRAFCTVAVLITSACQPVDYSKDISALRASRDSLAAALKITNANLQSTNNAMACLSASVSTIQAQLAIISGQISTLNTQISATNTTVAAHAATTASIQSQIKTIQDQIAVINAQQSATNASVTELSTSIASIQTQLTSILSQVATLNTQNLAFNKTIADISNTLTLSNNQLNLLLTQLNALLAKVPTLRDIDGNIYKTVIIGNQVWMSENLKVTKYRNGDLIPNVTNTMTWSSLVTGAYCDFTNNSTFGATYNPSNPLFQNGINEIMFFIGFGLKINLKIGL